MRRTVAYPYLLLGLFLFCWINLPKSVVDRARSFVVASFGHLFVRPLDEQASELARLQLENQSLRTQFEYIYEWLIFDERLGEQVEFLKGIEERKFAERRISLVRDLLARQLCSFPAQVIYRDPTSWSSSLWINVGEEDNRALGKRVIAKNSPVLSDGSLVGVVEYVGERQARVKLIVDSGLCPAVRVSRGASQNREIVHHLDALLCQLEKRDDFFISDAEKEQVLGELIGLKERGGAIWEDGYLAKGEVHGSSAPFWRSRGPMLKGIGFNYDYPDEEGPPRDLRAAIPILKEGDLLVTSGLDGVFPSNLRVGTVASVYPLKEGSYAYEVEVRPCANNLNDLETLFVLPSLSE